MILSVELMLEAGRRAQPDGAFWSDDTSAFAKQAASEAGYCIDAPDEMPASNVESFEVCDYELCRPAPTMFYREEFDE